MKRLWVQQTLAFSIVVIVTMGAVVLWINQGADAEFRKYITLREVRVPGSGVQELVEYYQQRGSWEGVESLLAEGIYFSDDWRGIRLGATLAEIGADERKRMPNVLLADADGRVVFDSDGRDKGRSLSRDEIANAWPVMGADDGEVADEVHPIGYLLLFYPVDATLDERDQSPERALATSGGCGPGCRRWRSESAG